MNDNDGLAIALQWCLRSPKTRGGSKYGVAIRLDCLDNLTLEMVVVKPTGSHNEVLRYYLQYHEQPNVVSENGSGQTWSNLKYMDLQPPSTHGPYYTLPQCISMIANIHGASPINAFELPRGELAFLYPSRGPENALKGYTIEDMEVDIVKEDDCEADSATSTTCESNLDDPWPLDLPDFIQFESRPSYLPGSSEEVWC